MTFNSVTYVVFLALVAGLYWALPARWRPVLICTCSIAFYSLWRPVFVLVMLFSATLDYLIALRLEREDRPAQRKLLIACTLVANLGLLAYFKYLLFAIGNIEAAFSLFGHPVALPHPEIILPLGISFYTFETISYSIDVYRRVIRAERNIVHYFCFVTFFPKLIAGPILRAAQLIPQFHHPVRLTWDDVLAALRGIAIGLFLKGVIADNIAPLVDDGFNRPIALWSAWDAWAMAFLFGFQIYFDFAAYSTIAIASSRLLGIRLPENFNFPYSAVSPRDFWKRWHISLSAWIRDYLYLPLLGEKFENRDGLPHGAGEASRLANTHPRALAVLFASWAIMGLWHGANWTFVLWGLMHAFFIAAYRLCEPLRQRWPARLRGLAGFAITLPCMMLAWIPFRAQNFGDALGIIGRVFTPSAYLSLGLRENTYLVVALLTLLVVGAEPVSCWLAGRSSERPWLTVATSFVVALVTVPLAMIFLRPITQFIYFQF